MNPSLCENGYFSLQFPWSGNQGWGLVIDKRVVVPDASPREGLYFAFDASYHKVNVVNQKGDVHVVSMSVDGIAWGGNNLTNTTRGNGDGDEGHLPFPNGVNCNPSPVHWFPEWDQWFGLYSAEKHKPTVCYVLFKQVNGDDPNAHIRNVSMHYSLKMGKPWAWQPGTYTGSYLYKVGPGGDLDFGDNIASSTATDVTINFTLTVSPNMYVRFNAGPNGVVNADLQPPGGWLNWQGKMPPYLSDDVQFDFGTSGPVKIHLANCDHPVGDTCGIVDLNGSGSPLGVDAFLTDNRLNNDGGKQAIRSRLSTNERVFKPNTDAGGTGVQPAHLLLKTQDGVTQQMQRGHHYDGHMTVVFDSNVN
ncbi:hypothetical protein [Burkholderia ubonensis]|uniref:hypothetical protein n=1 Tax=Burkholderia ubonensis TaxID=101571 RepID=UPI0012FBAB51|nr:hypothetical protein [Burkholderia ubonensis]